MWTTAISQASLRSSWEDIEGMRRARGGDRNAPRCQVQPPFSLTRLDFVPIGLAIAELLEGHGLGDRIKIFLAVDFRDGQALFLEEVDELGLIGLDLVRGARERPPGSTSVQIFLSSSQNFAQVPLATTVFR